MLYQYWEMIEAISILWCFLETIRHVKGDENPPPSIKRWYTGPWCFTKDIGNEAFGPGDHYWGATSCWCIFSSSHSNSFENRVPGDVDDIQKIFIDMTMMRGCRDGCPISGRLGTCPIHQQSTSCSNLAILHVGGSKRGLTISTLGFYPT